MNFFVALQFLTVLPSPFRRPLDDRALARAQVSFPLVGALLGLIMVVLDQLLGAVLARPIVAALLVGVLAALTGGLHLDGLIDSCDGLFVQRETEDRLKIMRDSHAGSFGVIGAVVVLVLKYAALSTLDGNWRPLTLVMAPMLSRWAMVYALNAFPYARVSGKGSAFVGYARWPVVLATIIAVTLSLGIWFLHGFLLMVLAAMWVALVGYFISKRLGGLTGDSYGAINETTETLILVAGTVTIGALA